MVTWAIKNYTNISLKTIIHAQPREDFGVQQNLH